MNTVLLSLYRFIIMPISVMLLPLAALFNAKARAGLALRKMPSEALPDGQNPIWIHAASGEFEYAKAVIRRLKERFPEFPIVVTYFSPTYAKNVAAFPGVDRSLALPLDLPGPCVSFLRKMHPRLLLVARTDLWPEMLEQCRRRGIPVALFSYTQKSFQQPLKKIFTRWMLHWVKRVYCVSTADRDHLNTLSLSVPIEVMGDTRYDQVAYRLSHAQVLPIGLHPREGIRCLVAGSTWPEDEAVLLPGLAELLLKNSLKLILVPHEPTPQHLSELERQLAQLGLDFAYFSNKKWDAEKVLIVDKVGVLAELYLLAEFAFVGGSFRKTVHSVMEALGAGCLTLVGPFHENNREAMEFKAIPIGDRYGLEVVHSHEELRDRMTDLLKANLAPFRQQLAAEFKRRLGASDKLIESLSDLI